MWQLRSGLVAYMYKYIQYVYYVSRYFLSAQSEYIVVHTPHHARLSVRIAFLHASRIYRFFFVFIFLPVNQPPAFLCIQIIISTNKHAQLHTSMHKRICACIYISALTFGCVSFHCDFYIYRLVANIKVKASFACTHTALHRYIHTFSTYIHLVCIYTYVHMCVHTRFKHQHCLLVSDFYYQTQRVRVVHSLATSSWVRMCIASSSFLYFSYIHTYISTYNIF